MNEIKKIDDEYVSTNMSLIKSMCANQSSKEEFDLFLYMAKTYQLDPLLKKIWLVKYGNKPAQIFTGRDGFLDIAHRSGKFNGMDTEITKINEPFDAKDYYGKVIAHFTDQYVAKCTIHRTDMEHPFIVTVYESEYNTGKALWLSKRRTMTGKVAESQAARKAFNISGLYSPDEMPEQDISNGNKKQEAEKEVKGTVVEPEEQDEKTSYTSADNVEKMIALSDPVKELFKAIGANAGQIIQMCEAHNWNESEIIIELSHVTDKVKGTKHAN